MKTARLTLALLALAAVRPATAQQLHMIDLGPGQALRINDIGQVAGRAIAPAGSHCFSWKSFTVTEIDTLGGTCDNTTGLNLAGQIVFIGQRQPYGSASSLWQNGTTLDLGTLGGNTVTAWAINESGLVVGSSSVGDGTSNYENHAFAWQNGVMTDLGGPGNSWAMAVDGSGRVAGMRLTAGVFRAVLWSGGVETDLTPAGWSGAMIWAMNDAGTMVGNGTTPSGEMHALVWRNGEVIDLGTLGGSQASASAVDAAGRVAGAGLTSAGDWHAFIWEAGAGMTDLGTLGGTMSSPHAIVNGQVIGESTTAEDADNNHAFLWRNGVMTDLGTLGGTWAVPFSINASGSIAGSSGTANGEEHAVLWATTPALLDYLVALAKSLAIPKEITAKLTSAATYLAAQNTTRACSELATFTNMVNAQSGKAIPASQVSQLTTGSSNIARLAGCR